MPFKSEGSYEGKANSSEPILITILIDQSGSMANPFGGLLDETSGKSKADIVADTVNKVIYDTGLRCSDGEVVKQRAFFFIVGYGKGKASVLLGSEKEPVSISELCDNPLRVETRVRARTDGAGGIVEEEVEFPVWIEPITHGNTPMRKAFDLAHSVILSWVNEHPNCLPPVLLNVTDGEWNEGGDPSSVARKISELRTDKGNVLVGNCHISSVKAYPVIFPTTLDDLPKDKFAYALFEMSSILPNKVVERAVEDGFNCDEGSVFMVFNADAVTMVQFVQFGTTKQYDEALFSDQGMVGYEEYEDEEDG